MTTGSRTPPPARQLRLAEFLAGLSLVSDVAMGHQPEQAIRASVLGVAIARRSGLDPADTRDVFYTCLLQHVGCTAYAHETALLFGDDIRLNEVASRTDLDDPRAVFTILVPGLAHGRGPLAWARIALTALTQGNRFGHGTTTAVCEVARMTAKRLGLSAGVQRGLHHALEGWNGKGGPQGLHGEDIAVAARIARVAGVATLFESIGGRDLARAVVAERSGVSLDPAIAALVLDATEALFGEVATDDPRATLLDHEPTPVVRVPETDIPNVARTFGELVDLKSPFFHGHATGVAALAVGGASRLGLSIAAQRDLEVAGFLHDLGRAAVSSAIWERPGPLSPTDWEQVRLHAYHSERVLAGIPSLANLAAAAGMHHERLDGSGYHRGTHKGALPIAARVLGAADAYQAMTEARPYRPALTADQAADALVAEAVAGRFDGDAVAAVLETAGQARRPRARPERPAGLSEREIEVLRLVAAGSSNKELAQRLSVSPRTAEHHIQHIYTKLGTSSRAAAALFAMEHDLLEPRDDG